MMSFEDGPSVRRLDDSRPSCKVSPLSAVWSNLCPGGPQGVADDTRTVGREVRPVGTTHRHGRNELAHAFQSEVV